MSTRAACFVVVFIVFLESIASTSRILEFARIASETTTIAVYSSTVATITHAFAAKAAISSTRCRKASTHTTFNTAELITIGARLLSFGSNRVDITKEFHQFLRAIADIDTLILPIIINEVELTKHAEERKVGARVVNNSFGTILDQEFK